MAKRREVIVVGGGLAGLSCAMKLAENGCFVKIISVTQVKRSHSVCAQGGINAAVNLKGEDDSPLIHAYDTLKGGDFLADQPPVVEMCLAAPHIIMMLDRFGCPFNRTEEGNIDFRRFGGTLYHRTAFCGASTGQQLLYALDEQVRKYESMRLVEKFEHHEFMRLVLDENGYARGVIMMDLFTLKLSVLKADAVVFGTGGPGLIFKKSTNSTFCTGAANGRLFMQGMQYANAEFIQIHPTAIPGEDKLRLMSESLRGEGGRVWVIGDSTKKMRTPDGKTIVCGETGKPWFFLEEMYPAFGNLVPRDVASREILRVIEAGLGIDGAAVYLDVTHLPESTLHKLESVLDIYEKFTGQNPRKVPMKIFPAMHYSMGGAWVDWPASNDPDRMDRYRQMTNLKGCFNVGESEFQYHGANRLGANSLVSCIFGGLVAGVEVPRYIDCLEETYEEISENVFMKDLQQERVFKESVLNSNGTESIFAIHEDLSNIMINHVSVKRNDKDLKRALESIGNLKERSTQVYLNDRELLLNQSYVLANQLCYMLEVAEVMTKCALLRKESRGAHFKPEYPDRDDENWLKTTIATYNPRTKVSDISYVPVDTRHIKPVQREYVHAKKTIPTFHNLPKNASLSV
ncbi:MAG: succinate dehydrogenase flavoprotein subunit [Chlamydiales bacterium]